MELSVQPLLLHLMSDHPLIQIIFLFNLSLTFYHLFRNSFLVSTGIDILLIVYF